MIHLLPGKKGLEKGQAVLVVLLVMSVILTLGLSAVSRSVTDVKISQQSQESARAFWTAQAGLEKSMLTQEATSGNVDGVDYTVTKTGLGGGTDFVFPEKISPSVVYWLVNHNNDGSIGSTFYSGDRLTIYWGNQGDSPALVASLVYKDTSGNFRSRKFAYDPVTRSPSTNFSLPDSGTGFSFGGNTFAYRATISGLLSLPGYDRKPYFVSIKMIYNTTSQILGIRTVGNGPVQGTCYESKATVTVSNVVRNLRECRTWPQTSDIFDYLLFSGGDI